MLYRYFPPDLSHVTTLPCETSDVSELRYLGIFIVKSRNLKCSLSNAKCNFYRAVNGIFSKILSFASQEVILELITRKCMSNFSYTA